jgi:hypothetical protein
MKALRKLSIQAATFALALGLLGAAPARAQHVRAFDGTTHSFAINASPQQDVRVTLVVPELVAPPETSAAHVDYYLKLHGVDGDSVSIRPGTAYSFTIDPRTAGEVIDARSGLRRVVVSYSVFRPVVDDAPLPAPGTTVELVSRTNRSGVLIALLVPAVQAAP